ncbi:hypothetical protein [Pedobacter jamesrossensis]|uniref:ParB-related ThiF-related cassette protein E domain-containing protein n=1 Tax=Pedobacter jamesrossensis TaxID=1908238 RepID=A0ABV8NQA0_9SPHI
MRTNFFQSINNLPEADSWKIDIAFTDESRMIVTVFSSEQKVKNELPVAIFVGSPKEINEVFFDALISKAKPNTSLFLNVEVHQQTNEFLKQVYV